MCGTCGCADIADGTFLTDPATGERRLIRSGNAGDERSGSVHATHQIAHVDGHSGSDKPHVHGPEGEVIPLGIAVMARNNLAAERNRGWFSGRNVLAINLMSSPGSGKTTLLEETIRMLEGSWPIYVIEGDQMTTNDAERIRRAGAHAIQINTGSGCHLEADMVGQAVAALDPASGSLVMIENVGNLVCPAMFDLGERRRVAVISTTEGEDKPRKYPHMFRASDIVIINKIDLASFVEFDEEACRAAILEVNPQSEILTVSAKTGEGIDKWVDLLRSLRRDPAQGTG